MKIQYASFLLPLHSCSSEQEELNRFLRGNRIIQTRKELASIDNVPHWAILVEYLDNIDKNTGDQTTKNKIDYKEILNPEDFSLFSKLRDIRKKLAEENGVPVYVVCTNDQLAEIAKKKPKNITECMKIEGIGQAKAGKYIPMLLECICSENNDKTPDTSIY